MKIRFGKIYHTFPTLSFSVGRSTFYPGLSIQVVIWKCGYGLEVTSQKAYQTFLEKFASRNSSKRTIKTLICDNSPK